MKAYFVRKATDHEVVGLFVASSVALLATVVDECCDPTSCEYALATMGGVMVSSVTASRWPLPDDSPAGRTGLEGAVLSQQWQEDLSEAYNGLEWRSLKPAVLRMLRALNRNAGRTEAGTG